MRVRKKWWLGPIVLVLVLFGALIVLFILFEPEGLVGVWRRFRDYFKIWPLPYISS